MRVGVLSEGSGEHQVSLAPRQRDPRLDLDKYEPVPAHYQAATGWSAKGAAKCLPTS